MTRITSGSGSGGGNSLYWVVSQADTDRFILPRLHHVNIWFTSFYFQLQVIGPHLLLPVQLHILFLRWFSAIKNNSNLVTLSPSCPHSNPTASSRPTERGEVKDRKTKTKKVFVSLLEAQLWLRGWKRPATTKTEHGRGRGMEDEVRLFDCPL